MVNVVLMKTRVSRLALSRDALVLEGTLVEIHGDWWTGKEKNKDGKAEYDQDEGTGPARLGGWGGGKEAGSKRKEIWTRGWSKDAGEAARKRWGRREGDGD